jgi:predicted nucleic acid-binding protein
MTIANISWSMSELLDRINKIKKPKFNRDMVWDVVPDKTSKNKKQKANFKEYILFLIQNGNSFFPISLGVSIMNNQEFWYAIDGNNRINACVTFLLNPYKIFSEYYKNIFDYIDGMNNEKITKENKNQIKEKIQKLSYQGLSTFSRLDNILNDDLLDILDRKNEKEIEKKLIEIQKKMRSKDGKPFDTSIKLIINELKNGTIKDYCQLFESIHKYANTLSRNELLASTLFDMIVIINDSFLKCEIIRKIKEYYDSRGEGEVLEKYTMDEDYNMDITAYDFMVGFQNLCSDKYKIIGKFTHNGTSIFFKLFDNIYNSVEKTNFTQHNVNDFIEKVTFACSIIEEAYKLIMPVNINNKYYNSQSKGACSGLIAENAMVILLTSTISHKDKTCRNELILKNRCIIIYHLLCNKIYFKKKNKKYTKEEEEEEEEEMEEMEEDFKHFNKLDKLTYQAGGAFIDNECKNILNGKNIFTITKNDMSNLLYKILNYSLNNRKNKSSSNKRRQLNMYDKILISTFWYVKISQFYIEKTFETEHITPFSSKWEGEMDIDRIGNLFPTLHTINSERGNKNLEIYYAEKNKDFTNLISDLLPSNYDEFNKRIGKTGRQTCIISIEKYNEYCERNEKLYIKTLLDNLFPDNNNM